MHKKHLIVLAAVVTAAIAGTALAKGPLGQHFTPQVPVTWSCPPMVIPPNATILTDWTLESPQGWLDHGAIVQGTTVQMFQCSYGVDKASPSQRPAFQMHRVIPTNFHNCSLDAPKTTLTCYTDAPPTATP